VKVLLNELSSDELIAGLRNGMLELAIMLQPSGEQIAGIEFELLRTYPYYVALTVAHPFARLKSIPLETVATEPLIGLRRRDFPEYYRYLNPQPHFSLRPASNHALQWNATVVIRSSLKWKPGTASGCVRSRLANACSTAHSPAPTEPLPVGIARATKGDVTPGGEKFCEILRKTSAARAMPEWREHQSRSMRR
jgi:DNA-binding transcriptional LysR family regulator